MTQKMCIILHIFSMSSAICCTVSLKLGNPGNEPGVFSPGSQKGGVRGPFKTGNKKPQLSLVSLRAL